MVNAGRWENVENVTNSEEVGRLGDPVQRWQRAVARRVVFSKPSGKFVGSIGVTEVTNGQCEHVSKISISKRRVNVRVEQAHEEDGRRQEDRLLGGEDRQGVRAGHERGQPTQLTAAKSGSASLHRRDDSFTAARGGNDSQYPPSTAV